MDYYLTQSDNELLARLVAEWQSGAFRRGGGNRQHLFQRMYEPVPFINAAGESIPAYAVMRVTTPTTVSGEMFVNVAKPDATYRWRYLINSHEEISTGGSGWGTWIWDSDKVLYDTSVATPAFNERWGPKSGEWKLFQHRPGFIIDGRYSSTDGVLWAMQLPPGEVRVKNDDGSGTLAANGGPRTFGIYGGSAGTTDTGLEVSLYNSSSTAWAADKYGFATADAGGVIWGAPHQT